MRLKMQQMMFRNARIALTTIARCAAPWVINIEGGANKINSRQMLRTLFCDPTKGLQQHWLTPHHITDEKVPCCLNQCSVFVFKHKTPNTRWLLTRVSCAQISNIAAKSIKHNCATQALRLWSWAAKIINSPFLDWTVSTKLFNNL